MSYEIDATATVLQLTPDIHDPKTVDTLFKPTLLMYQHSPNNNQGVCMTAISPSCIANSTLCEYKEGFTGGDNYFGTTFPMSNEVAECIAREACTLNDGMVDIIPGNVTDGREAKYVCACSVSAQNKHAKKRGAFVATMC